MISNLLNFKLKLICGCLGHTIMPKYHNPWSWFMAKVYRYRYGGQIEIHLAIHWKHADRYHTDPIDELNWTVAHELCHTFGYVHGEHEDWGLV